MAMKTEYDAPAPFDYEVWQPDPDWDCSPELQPIERDTLINLAQYVVGRHKQNWSTKAFSPDNSTQSSIKVDECRIHNNQFCNS
ncbi:hypothetical protein KTK49_004397 [Salmonella enterica]|nr:hypothetical protein [Salmonella enterica]EGD2776614.1 hypothetical protein [Salmonella enterica]EGH1502987.1 hypothetical protein [Salmonella enterica]EGH4835457.1 hypothetical protein [Salmonella enterica]EGH8323529.1 hypothetical protein [Salmonella enterica]